MNSGLIKAHASLEVLARERELAKVRKRGTEHAVSHDPRDGVRLAFGYAPKLLNQDMRGLIDPAWMILSYAA